MKKLFALKKWLTLQEAARHLAIVFGEDVCEADVLRLALDGHLKLSVNFINHVKAIKGKVVPIENASYHEMHPFTVACLPKKLVAQAKGAPIEIMDGVNLDDERVLELESHVINLQGVNDLVMLGAERIDVENRYQELTNGPPVTLVQLHGAFVFGDGDSDVMYQLQERFDQDEHHSYLTAPLRELKTQIQADGPEKPNIREILGKYPEERQQFDDREEERRTTGQESSDDYYPAGGLPDDSVLVVRTDALREFEQSVNTPLESNGKPVTMNERITLLIIIAALCDYSAIDPAARGTASQIAGLTAELGAPVTDETILKVLVKIPNAVERRMK